MEKKFDWWDAGFFFVVGFGIGMILFLFLTYPQDSQNAPSDFINEKDIIVYKDKVVLNVSGVSLGRYANSGSMIPTLDFGSNGLRIIPTNESDIHLGDIITFKKEECEDSENNTSNCTEFLVIHRVVKIGNDKNGTYFVTKGDNNFFKDKKIRFDDIKYITIGVLW